MDCPTEEQIIRNRLKSIEEIEQLDFDLMSRELTVTHYLDDSRSLFVLPTLYNWFERDEATSATISEAPADHDGAANAAAISVASNGDGAAPVEVKSQGDKSHDIY